MDKVLLKGAIEKTQVVPTEEQQLDQQQTSQQAQLKPGIVKHYFQSSERITFNLKLCTQQK